MISLEGVTKQFPGVADPAVENLTFEVASGEVCVVIGPSGCGKSTTLRMINRLIEPTSGKICLDGRDTATLDPLRLRRRMGYVIQDVGLFPHMTIAENIATVPREERWPSERIRQRVDELLMLVGLEPGQYRNRLPRSLSGGQRQRVGVARALAADPPVLLMDEPFGAVDPVTRVHLQGEFARLQNRVRKTVLFVTHDMDEAMKLGDRIAVLHEGRLVQHASPRELLGGPGNSFVESLVGEDRALKRLRFVRVEEISRAAAIVPRGSTLGDARGSLSRNANGCGYVLDSSNRIVGRISVDKLEGGSSDLQVDQLMTPAAEAIKPDTSGFEALCRMLKERVAALPIVSDTGELVGEVDFEQILWGAERRG